MEPELSSDVHSLRSRFERLASETSSLPSTPSLTPKPDTLRVGPPNPPRSRTVSNLTSSIEAQQLEAKLKRAPPPPPPPRSVSPAPVALDTDSASSCEDLGPSFSRSAKSEPPSLRHRKPPPPPPVTLHTKPPPIPPRSESR